MAGGQDRIQDSMRGYYSFRQSSINVAYSVVKTERFALAPLLGVGLHRSRLSLAACTAGEADLNQAYTPGKGLDIYSRHVFGRAALSFELLDIGHASVPKALHNDLNLTAGVDHPLTYKTYETFDGRKLSGNNPFTGPVFFLQLTARFY